jgi:hypothetical protein
MTTNTEQRRRGAQVLADAFREEYEATGHPGAKADWRRWQARADGTVLPATTETQQALEAALASLQRLDPERWAGWVCYLLEGLEGLRPDEADHMLRAVRDGIEERLEAGRW